MLTDLLFPDTSDFLLATIQILEDRIVCTVRSIADQAACPLCGQPSHQIRGHYVRHLSDLPWATRSVHVHLRVRKFQCRVPACPRQIFTERLPDLVRPFARRTVRMEQTMRQLALTAGARVVRA